MKRIILLLLFIVAVFFEPCFSQDSIYDDYFLFASPKLISLDLEKAEMVDVLKMLSQQTGLNFISTEAVKERILTLYLENVPLEEAMDILFKANNLAYDYYPDASIFIVKEMGKPTIELKTVVYHLRYARVGSSKVEKEVLCQLGGSGGGSSGGGEDTDIGIKGAVESVLSEVGKVIEEPLTNSLVVVDVPSQFSIIDEVVKKLDIPIPKVMIEVEMLDVSKSVMDKFGVNWPEALMRLDMSLCQRTTAFPFRQSKMANQSGNIAAVTTEEAASGWSDVSWGANHFGPTILTVVGAELVLNFLRSQADTKYLARPKILTLSNQTAEIKITADEAVGVTKTESDTDTTYTIERVETGVKLTVTPQVDKDTKDITLVMNMTVKASSDSGFTTEEYITGNIKNTEERSAKAIMRLKDGQTLFIGGLIKKGTTDTRSKVPILSDIPLIGRFFRYKYLNKEDRELMVFLTPHIIEDRPSLAGKAERFNREQRDYSKENSIKIALDSFPLSP